MPTRRELALALDGQGTNATTTKGPRTLQLKLQKNSLSSIHTSTFFHNCNDFSNIVLYMDNDFPNDFLRKIFVKIFVVCKGLKKP